MKKSECYRTAQKAVVEALGLNPETKIQTLKLLLEAEALEVWREEQAEKREEQTK